MDDIRNCPRCGGVFVYRGREICPRCVREEEDQFERVRQFLRTSPAATLEEVVEATGVPAELILHFMRLGRLIPGGGLRGLLSCQRCGAPIDEGHLCAGCARELAVEVGRAASGASAGAGAGEEGAEPREPAAGGPARGRMHVADLVVKKRTAPDDK